MIYQSFHVSQDVRPDDVLPFGSHVMVWWGPTQPAPPDPADLQHGETLRGPGFVAIPSERLRRVLVEKETQKASGKS